MQEGPGPAKKEKRITHFQVRGTVERESQLRLIIGVRFPQGPDSEERES